MIDIAWGELPETVRETVTAGIRKARDTILRGLAEGGYPDVEGPWRDPEIVAALYNAALVQLGAKP